MSCSGARSTRSRVLSSSTSGEYNGRSVSEKTTAPRPWRPFSATPSQAPIVVTVLSGKERGRSFRLRLGEQLIGRDARADIQLDDSGVSREHAKIVWTPQGVINLLDLRSKNGTGLNGARVDVAILRPGDRIQVGPDVELLFGHDVPGAVAQERAAVASELRRNLSIRQLQVAKLVADGLTNRQIAKRLNIKVRTVESHLDSAYAKLGINSRSELTRAVVEAGLLTRGPRGG